MNGFLNLLKPPGMTSSDAVVLIRRKLPKGTRIGHGGTLDPDAAGVLPICIGKATRLFDYIIDKQKTYIGELRLGVTTQTDDASGRILTTRPVNADAAAVEETLKAFTGEIMQRPPVYSALKSGGEAFYKKARRGETVDLQARKARIDELEILSCLAADRYLLRVHCGKGVYIRALMRDIGEKLGCGGHMSFLLRSESGVFTVNEAVALDELSDMEKLASALKPLDAPLKHFPMLPVDEARRKNVLDGQTIRPDWILGALPDLSGPLRVYIGGDFAGMAQWEPDGAHMKCMLLDRETGNEE